MCRRKRGGIPRLRRPTGNLFSHRRRHAPLDCWLEATEVGDSNDGLTDPILRHGMEQIPEATKGLGGVLPGHAAAGNADPPLRGIPRCMRRRWRLVHPQPIAGSAGPHWRAIGKLDSSAAP